MTDTIAAETFAAFTRGAIAHYQTADAQWDSIPMFMVLGYDAEKAQLYPHTIAGFAPDIKPAEYPAAMLGVVRKTAASADVRLVGLTMQVEAWAVRQPGASATEAEREQFMRDTYGQRYHTRPDRVEVAQAVTIDRDCRMWHAILRRPRPGHIDEDFESDARPRVGADTQTTAMVAAIDRLRKEQGGRR